MNYFDAAAAGSADGQAISISLKYRTNVLIDTTQWLIEGQGFEKGFDKWEDEERLTLALTISHNDLVSLPAEASQEIRCVACLDVDEDSVLRDGDKGFAACYYTTKGNYYDATLKR